MGENPCKPGPGSYLAHTGNSYQTPEIVIDFMIETGSIYLCFHYFDQPQIPLMSMHVADTNAPGCVKQCTMTESPLRYFYAISHG